MSEPRFISQHLHRLFADHDCVVIPGLGGFVCNERPARYDESRQELIPPARDILFNERLIHNDGVLAHVFSATSGKGYTEALAEIEREADWMRAALRAGDAVTLAHVGRLFRKSPTEPVSFAASPELERFLQSFGLQRIPLRPLTAAEPPAAEQKPAAPVVPLNPVTPGSAARKTDHPMWRRIAAAVAIPLIAGSAWWGFQQEASLLNVLPTMGWSNSAVPGSYQPRFAEEGVHVPLPVASVDENRLATLMNSVTDAATVRYDFVADEVSETGTLVRIKEVVEEEKRTVEPVEEERFWLVAGAFGVSANAENHASAARAKGWNAEVRPGSNGLNMVILGAFSSASAARVEMARIREAGDFQVWLKTL